MDPKSGGPCQGIRNITPELDALNIATEILSFDEPGSDFDDGNKLTIHRIGPFVGPYGYCKNLKSWLLSNFSRFDAILIHGLWQYNSFGTLWSLRRIKASGAKIPKIYVIPHGMLDPYFQNAKDRRLKAIRNYIFWWLFERKVINESDGVLFTCEEELLLAKNTFKGYQPKKEVNIGYGIREVPDYTSAMRNSFNDSISLPEGKSFILFLSRIHLKKGVDLLVSAYLDLKAKGHELPDLVIAGPGLDSPFGKRVVKLANFDDQIHFPGMLSGLSKWGAFHGCEAFILPSHQENFGISVVEALACGKPVLISNQVNIWREIEDGGGGIVEEDNYEGVVRMLNKWNSLSEEIKHTNSLSARNIYLNHFDISKSSLNFRKFLESEI